MQAANTVLKWTLLVIGIAAGILSCVVPARGSDYRPRVIIAPFEGDWPYGDTTVASFLGQFLSQSGLMVVDRASFDRVLEEQFFTRSEYADPATRIQAGRIVGAQYLISGLVGAPSYEYGNRNLSLGWLGQVSSSSQKARVSVEGALINLTTAESIPISVVGEGKSEQWNLYGSGLGSTNLGSQSDPQAKAHRDAARKFASAMMAAFAQPPAIAKQFPAGQAPVLEVRSKEGDLILGAGEEDGVQVGYRYEVQRPSTWGAEPTGWTIEVVRLDPVNGHISYAMPAPGFPKSQVRPEKGDLAILLRPAG